MKNQKAGSNSTGIKAVNFENKWLPFFFFFCAFFLYAKTISFDYACDDGRYTFNNTYVQDGITSFSNLITKGTQEGCSKNSKYVPDYRPITLISFAIENTVFGSNPKISHLINVLIYSYLCMLLFIFLKRIYTDYAMWIPSFMCLLFISIPVHTEVVANIKSRDEILSMLFGLISLIQILKYLELSKIRHFITGMFAFLCCIFSKESGFVFLGLIPMTIYFKSKANLKSNIIVLSFLISITVISFYIRWRVIGNVVDKNNYLFIWNPLLEAPDQGTRIATAFAVALKSILLIIFPIKLSWDYSYNEIPFSKWSDLFTIFSVITYLALIYVVIAGVKKRNNFSFAIGYFLIASAITANIFFISPIIFSERTLFISSLGFCMAFPLLIESITKQKKSINQSTKEKISKGVILTWILLFALKTTVRSSDWENDEKLYLSGVKTSPNSCRTHYALASYYFEKVKESNNQEDMQNNINLAIDEYKKVIEIYPKYNELYYNLGVAYFYKSNLDSAESMYKIALKMDSADFKSINNYAYLMYFKKDYFKAINLYKRAFFSQSGENLSLIYHSTGICYRELHNYDSAKYYFLKAIEINSNNTDAVNGLNSLNGLKKAGTTY